MNLGKYAEKIIISIGLILLFTSSPIGSIKDYSYLSDYLFRFGALFIIIAVIHSLINKEWLMNDSLKKYTYLYSGFIGSIILSIIVNQSLEVEIYSLEKFSLMFLLLGFLLSMTEVSEKIIINSLIISLTVIMISFLINYPLSEMTTKAYTGGFRNSNTFGIVVVTLSSVGLVTGTSLLKDKKNSPLAIIYLFIGFGAAYLTILSASRTAFITLAIIFVIISVTFTYEVLKTRNLLNWKSILITFSIAFAGAGLFVFIDNPIYATLESNIIDKFIKKIEGAGGITDGRAGIWKSIIENVDFFGTVNYFEELRHVHAHNSFFQILSKYGWIAILAYAVFWLGMLIKSVHYYVTEKLTKTYALLPFVVIINFILLSMTELVQFHVATYLAMSMIAIFSKSNDSKLKTEI